MTNKKIVYRIYTNDLKKIHMNTVSVNLEKMKEDDILILYVEETLIKRFKNHILRFDHTNRIVNIFNINQ